MDIDWAGPGIIPHRPKTPGTPTLEHGGAAVRWLTPEDWQALPQVTDTPALVLFHGLEGSSASHYAQAIAQHFRARGWIVAIPHFRGCSGVPNRLARAYHSGDSEDIDFLLQSVRMSVPNARWHAAGVSMGGNMLLKYLGEQGERANWLTASAGISVPLDLEACGSTLSDTWAGRLYAIPFLRTMKRKVLEKAYRFPAAIDVLRISRARNLREFDDAYTAPMHGFASALDYWTSVASKPFLKKIEIPTLVLNARNDPFMPAPTLPGPQDCAQSVTLHQPADGGHAGFPTGAFPTNLSWLPQRLGRFFETGL